MNTWLHAEFCCYDSEIERCKDSPGRARIVQSSRERVASTDAVHWRSVDAIVPEPRASHVSAAIRQGIVDSELVPHLWLLVCVKRLCGV